MGVTVHDSPAEESDCGHTIVTVAGETQHHDLPTEDHSPTSDCWCTPNRLTAGGHVVYQHPDPEVDADAALWASLSV